MIGSSFHVTLPSNSNLDVCPDNKPTDYTVHLMKSVNLDGEWEVKLNSITIPYNWKTATFNCNVHCAYLPKSSTKAHTDGLALDVDCDAAKRSLLEQYSIVFDASVWGNTMCKTGKFAFNHTFADSAKTLGDEIAHRVNVELGLTSAVKFIYDRETTTGRFVAEDNGLIFIYINGSPKLARYLGCRFAKVAAKVHGSSNTSVIDNFWLITESGPVVMSNFVALDQIYIYTDVIKNQLVGNAEAPLLATFAMPKKSLGEKYHHEFLNEKYLPLSSTTFQRIHVKLATGKGIPIPFAPWSTEVTIELHFRKRI